MEPPRQIPMPGSGFEIGEMCPGLMEVQLEYFSVYPFQGHGRCSKVFPCLLWSSTVMPVIEVTSLLVPVSSLCIHITRHSWQLPDYRSQISPFINIKSNWDYL